MSERRNPFTFIPKPPKARGKQQTSPLTIPPATKAEVGDRFGWLTVREPEGGEFPEHNITLVECDCGTRTGYYTADILAYRTVTCGCLSTHGRATGGDRFGRIIKLDTKAAATGTGWFECDCGHRFVEHIKSVRTGVVTACISCRRAEAAAQGVESPAQTVLNLCLILEAHDGASGVTIDPDDVKPLAAALRALVKKRG